jgi:hypothetical protein
VAQVDRTALAIITILPGKWEVATHQGHIVKLARKDREMTVEQAVERYKDLLTAENCVLE